MKPGYYNTGAEVYHITGKKRGNRYYNLWAEKPRWAEIYYKWLPKYDTLRSATYSETNPVLHLTTTR